MATNSSGHEEELTKMAELSKTLKEGERIVAPTRRPDGTLRKPIRIRAGYVPQDEVAIYQSKGALWKKEMQSLQAVPPGYDQPVDAKPKTKSVKRNERKKEKRLQAALEKGKNLEASSDGDIKRGDLSVEVRGSESDSVKSLTSQMNGLDVSSNSVASTPLADSIEALDLNSTSPDIDKKIRALKKKIRLAEAQLQKAGAGEMKPEQSDKLTKLEGWQTELKVLESKKAQQQTATTL